MLQKIDKKDTIFKKQNYVFKTQNIFVLKQNILKKLCDIFRALLHNPIVIPLGKFNHILFSYNFILYIC